MIPEELLTAIFSGVPYLLIKLFVIILLLLHLSFSAVLTRQTKLMITVVEANISPAIYAVSIIHLLTSLFVLAWAILFL